MLERQLQAECRCQETVLESGEVRQADWTFWGLFRRWIVGASTHCGANRLHVVKRKKRSGSTLHSWEGIHTTLREETDQIHPTHSGPPTRSTSVLVISIAQHQKLKNNGASVHLSFSVINSIQETADKKHKYLFFLRSDFSTKISIFPTS